MTAEGKQATITLERDNPGPQRIYISGRIWHELYPKVDPGLFLEALREKIDLEQYGDGIATFYFTFVVLENITDNFSEWLGTGYNPETAELDIAVELPYTEIVASDRDTVIRIMERALLSGIDRIAGLDLVSPFDYATFRADVVAIFAEELWYEPDPPTS